MFYYDDALETPIGTISVVWSQDGIHALYFAKPEALDDLLHAFQRQHKTGPLIKRDASLLITGITSRTHPTVLHGTPFQRSVWKALQDIPLGATSTYKEIAMAIGRPTAYRAVGNAIGANPTAYIIPCHRVLTSCGKLGGFRWGSGVKKRLLSLEGLGKNILTD